MPQYPCIYVTSHSGKTYLLGEELSRGSYGKVYNASMAPNVFEKIGVGHQNNDEKLVIKVNFDQGVHFDELKIMN